VLQSRNLLYTAVTRASKMVILVGKPEVLRNMIANNHHVRRYSMLKKFLIDA
jgi:exodeoxyribonuclease V alpha subunit